MDTASSSAIISATAGISGVLLGNSFVAIKEWLVGRSKRGKDAAYLSIIVVSHLERFANGCLHVAFDDGTSEGRPAGRNGEEYQSTTRPPEFQPLDIQVEWKVLPNELMYEILRLPDQREQIQSRLGGIAEYDDDYPDHTEYFWVRRRDYAELGLRASDLVKRLHTYAGITAENPKPGEWSRDEGLRDVIERIDGERAAAKRRAAERQVPDTLS
ncbi:hypothetical protein WCQ02_29285 [Paraburkholderia tropica]|uniref:hypothetical protein n=1 Tax=Paraburkholderia tropica TaxID=92647 RepID=UPI00301B42EC